MVTEGNGGGKETKGKVSWNLSEAVTIELGELLKTASGLYLRGSTDHWYITLRAIKMRLVPKLSKEERTQLFNIEYRILLSKKHKRPIGHLIEQYNDRLLDLLELKGFYPQDMEDRSRIN